MKTLVIHPFDTTTDFLKPIYSHIPDTEKTVITGGVFYTEVQKLIELHDQIIICGHGSTEGLFSVAQFNDLEIMDTIIDEDSISYLQNKKIVAIWCYASTFMEKYKLKNVFCTGMFCSEVHECLYCGIENISQKDVDESNDCFSLEMQKLIDLPNQLIYNHILTGKYSKLAKTNRVARYNLERMSCFD